MRNLWYDEHGPKKGTKGQKMLQNYNLCLSNPTGINNVVISPQTYFTTPLKHREELKGKRGLKNKKKHQLINSRCRTMVIVSFYV